MEMALIVEAGIVAIVLGFFIIEVVCTVFEFPFKGKPIEGLKRKGG